MPSPETQLAPLQQALLPREVTWALCRQCCTVGHAVWLGLQKSEQCLTALKTLVGYTCEGETGTSSYKAFLGCIFHPTAWAGCHHTRLSSTTRYQKQGFVVSSFETFLLSLVMSPLEDGDETSDCIMFPLRISSRITSAKSPEVRWQNSQEAKGGVKQGRGSEGGRALPLFPSAFLVPTTPCYS